MNKNLTLEKDNMENSTKISLSFSGDDIPLENITNILEVEPNLLCKKKQHRIQNEFTKDWWLFDLKEMNCCSLEKLFQKFINIFGSKTEFIKKIEQEYNCNVQVIIVIHMVIPERPEMSLSPATLAFLNSINATLDFDIYAYDSEEDDF